MRLRAFCILGLPLALACQNVLGITGDTRVEPPATDGGVQYHDLATASNWASYDSTMMATQTFLGGTFDGRYVYFAPSFESYVARYDTEEPFEGVSSWTHNDAFSTGGAAGGGAAFDGRFAYFIAGTVIARYDSYASSSSPSSGRWIATDINSLAMLGLLDFPDGSPWTSPADASFVGATFDGRFLYLAPTHGSVIARFDTTQDLANTAAWEVYDSAALGVSFRASTGAYQGPVFDGRYVYFIPGGTQPVLRYNAEIDFAEKAAWSTFATDSLEPDVGDFCCGAYDGRYLYLVPSGTSLAVRYDTTLSFSSKTSWSVFDTTTVNPKAAGFGGSAFDGRYVYFVPGDTSSIARYDDQAEFTDRTSWEVFDPAQVVSSSGGFGGAVFDGRYIYLVPTKGGNVVRFDARTPRSLPTLPESSGSFL